jgi:hypothetical protein
MQRPYPLVDTPADKLSMPLGRVLFLPSLIGRAKMSVKKSKACKADLRPRQANKFLIMSGSRGWGTGDGGRSQLNSLTSSSFANFSPRLMACETEGRDIPKYRANSFKNTFPTTCASSQTTTYQILTSPHVETIFNELPVLPHSLPLP